MGFPAPPGHARPVEPICENLSNPWIILLVFCDGLPWQCRCTATEFIQASRRGAARCCRLSPPQTGRADFPHPASPERLLTGHYELAMRPVTFFQRCVVVRSGKFQAAHRSSSVTTFWQGPFAPSALPKFFATTNPSDSRSGRLPVIYSRQALPPAASAIDGTRSGLPSSVVDLSTPAVLSHPGELARCIRSLLRGRCWLHHIWLSGRSQLRNEA